MYIAFNSLALGGFGCKLKLLIFKLLPKVSELNISYEFALSATETNWWYANTGSSNGLVWQANWGNIDPDCCHCMAPLCDKGLDMLRILFYRSYYYILCSKLDSSRLQTYKTSKSVITLMPGDSYIYSSVKYTLLWWSWRMWWVCVCVKALYFQAHRMDHIFTQVEPDIYATYTKYDLIYNQNRLTINITASEIRTREPDCNIQQEAFREHKPPPCQVWKV